MKKVMSVLALCGLLALSGGLLLLAWWLHERFRRERQPGMTPLTFSGGPQ